MMGKKEGMTMTDVERARKVFAGNYFAQWIGCDIDAVAPGYARCSMELRPEHNNALGRVMGGAVYTLADFAYAVASNFDRDVFVTSSSDIRFLRAATGTRLVAEAREVRSGRRSCLFEVEIRDDRGELVALAEVAGSLLMKRKDKDGWS